MRLPILERAAKFGTPLCRSLPFIHSLSGRDTTSHPYFTSKKTWQAKSKTVKLSALESFAEDGQSCQVAEEVLSQAHQLLVAVYSKKHELFSEMSLDVMRAYKFLNNRSTLLKLLP